MLAGSETPVAPRLMLEDHQLCHLLCPLKNLSTADRIPNLLPPNNPVAETCSLFLWRARRRVTAQGIPCVLQSRASGGTMRYRWLPSSWPQLVALARSRPILHLCSSREAIPLLSPTGNSDCQSESGGSLSVSSILSKTKVIKSWTIPAVYLSSTASPLS